MKSLLVSVALASGAVLAQVRAPTFLRMPRSQAEPALVDAGTAQGGAAYVSMFGDGGGCLRLTTNGRQWGPCLANTMQLEEVADAGSARLASEAARLGAQLDTLEARLNVLADAGMTKTEANGVINNMNARIDAVADAGASITGVAARVSALESRVDALALAAASGRTVCGSASVVGVSIPVVGVSGPTNVPVPNAVGGRPCLVAAADTLPLTAFPRCDAVDGGAVLRFRAAGLLSALAVPTGTYSTCVVNP